MLSVNRIGISPVGIRRNKEQKSKVSFAGLKPDIYQQKQFLEKLFELPAAEISKRFVNSLEFLPDTSKELYYLKKEANQFFQSVGSAFKKNPQSTMRNAIGDALNLEPNSIERDYTDGHLRKYYNEIVRDEKYDKFIEKLSDGLFDSRVIENSPPSVESKVAATVVKKEVKQKPKISQGVDSLDIKPGFKPATLADFEPQEQYASNSSVKDAKVKNKKSKFNQPSKQYVSVEQKKEMALAKKAKLRAKKSELDRIVEEKLATDRIKMVMLEGQLESNTTQIKNIEKQIAEAEAKRGELSSSSEFDFASDERNSYLGKIKTMSSEKLNCSPEVILKKLAEHDINMPRTSDYANKEAYHSSMSLWASKRAQLNSDYQKSSQSQTDFLPAIRILRRNIAELNKKYPSAEYITKKINQAKKFLDWQNLNGKDIYLLDNRGKDRKGIYKLQSMLSQYKAENNYISRILKTDYAQKLSEHALKMPKIEDFATSKDFNKAVIHWRIKQNKLEKGQQQVDKYNRNKVVIEKLTEELEKMEQSRNFNAIDSRRMDVMKLQQKRLKKSLAKKLPTGETVRKYLKSLISKNEDRYFDLVWSRKGIGELDSKIANLKNEKQNCEDSIGSILKQINSLKRVQTKRERQVRINRNKALREAQRAKNDEVNS